MAGTLPFAPGATTTISVTTSSGTGTLTGDGLMVEIQNAGSVTVFVAFAATAAVATGYPILAGQSKVVSRGPGQTTLAAITASSTATLYATVGDGQ
jgi:hypothetical protein